MKVRNILSGALALAVSASAAAVCASAEPMDEGIFIIGVADNDWKVSFWGKAGDPEGLTSALQQTAKLDGNGTYTVSIDLSAGYTVDGWVDEDTGDLLELTTGNGIAVLGVQIYGDYPTLGVDVTSLKVDGTEIALSGRSVTNDEDKGRRTNLYNQWANYDSSKEDHVTMDPDSATMQMIDPGDIGEWSKLEITFDVYGLDDAAPAATEAAPAETEAAPAATEAAPAETQAPAAGDVAAATDSSKGSPETGIADVAVIAGLAIVAGGAVLVAKKRK
ncbi:MAG: LPXTG cell wall anchor domain-containing protein [Ruminiclostridium sp.]|nr:LPXTG cell wall anchor domain-containing protein [Ruminiclostridium sp.]